jgi:hypothetical protein
VLTLPLPVATHAFSVFHFYSLIWRVSTVYLERPDLTCGTPGAEPLALKAGNTSKQLHAPCLIFKTRMPYLGVYFIRFQPISAFLA